MVSMKAAEGSNSVYHGQFSDGRSAATREVQIFLSPLGVEILDGNNGETFGRWPWNELTSSVFLQQGEPVHLANKTLAGARIYVPNNAGLEADFARQLIARVPKLSRKRANRRVVYGLVGAGVVILSAIIGLSLSDFSLAETVARQVPEKWRKGFGDQVVASLSGGRAACRNPAGVKAFDKLVGRLSAGAGQSGKFNIQVMPLSMMNAFAAPGERIVVGKKLIDFVKSPEELAGVIAHEMGHGIKMHPEAGIVRSIGISAAISIAFGGAAGSLGDIGAVLLQLKYSRTAETQADKIALEILEKAQIPAKPFAAFFTRLDNKRSLRKLNANKKKGQLKTEANENAPAPGEKKKNVPGSSGLSKTLNLFSSHPASPERIKLIYSQPDWQTRPLLSVAEWQALGKICDAR